MGGKCSHNDVGGLEKVLFLFSSSLFMDNGGCCANPHQHVLEWNPDPRRAIKDDDRGTFLAEVAGKHIPDQMVLMQKRQNRLCRARHDSLILLLLIDGLDIERHPTRVFHREAFNILFRPHTPQEIIFGLAEWSWKEDECPVNPIVNLSAHQEELQRIGTLRFFHAEIEAVLPELLAHVTRVPARTTIRFSIWQPRQERSYADLSPINSGPLHLAKLPFGLGKHFFSSRKTVELPLRRDLARPAHVRCEHTVTSEPRGARRSGRAGLEPPV